MRRILFVSMLILAVWGRGAAAEFIFKPGVPEGLKRTITDYFSEGVESWAARLAHIKTNISPDLSERQIAWDISVGETFGISGFVYEFCQLNPHQLAVEMLGEAQKRARHTLATARLVLAQRAGLCVDKRVDDAALGRALILLLADPIHASLAYQRNKYESLDPSLRELYHRSIVHGRWPQIGRHRHISYLSRDEELLFNTFGIFAREETLMHVGYDMRSDVLYPIFQYFRENPADMLRVGQLVAAGTVAFDPDVAPYFVKTAPDETSLMPPSLEEALPWILAGGQLTDDDGTAALTAAKWVETNLGKMGKDVYPRFDFKIDGVEKVHDLLMTAYRRLQPKAISVIECIREANPAFDDMGMGLKAAYDYLFYNDLKRMGWPVLKSDLDRYYDHMGDYDLYLVDTTDTSELPYPLYIYDRPLGDCYISARN